MWKWKEEEKPVTPPAPEAPAPVVSVKPSPVEGRSMEVTRQQEPARAASAHIGNSVLIKGEISGSEDLYIDGEVQGTVQLRDHTLIVGPNGRVHATVEAKNVVIHGSVDGNVRATERLELKKTARVVGDLAMARLAIDDGAFLKGGIETMKPAPPEAARESKPEKREPVAAPVAPASAQGTLLEPVKLLETVKK